jgi:hypothetical protein
VQTLYLTLKPQGTDQVVLRYWSNDARSQETQVLPLTAMSGLLQQCDSDLMDLAPNLERMGKQLFGWLQGSTSWLSQAIRDCPDEGLVLAISATESLSSLPWEALHDGTQFLVEQVGPIVSIVRWVEAAFTPKPPAQRSLQVLFMATSPENVQPVLDFEAEEASILQATQDLH